MSSVFDGLWAEGVAVLDEACGELFAVEPRIAPPNGRAVADTTRPPCDIIGTFLDNAQASFGMAPGHAADAGQKVVAGHARIVVTLAGLLYVPARPDRVTRDKNGETFEVGNVVPDGFGRATIHLTARRPAP